jgi:glycosyltransferase involved in cell wall biosynthesis
MSQINYTIIIPHKNCPPLLQRCLDSIPRQEDVQIIVVDDNSDDTKVDFESFPGLYDPYIETIFTKEGKGAGYARNVGLERAKGKWLIFADADDYFNSDFSTVLKTYLDDDNEIIFFKIQSVLSGDSNPHINGFNFLNSLIENVREKNNWDALKCYFLGPVSKLIKRRLVLDNQIRFQEVSHSNDVLFSLRTAYVAKKIDISFTFFYCVTYNPGSLTWNVSEDSLVVRFHVACESFVFLKTYNVEDYAKYVILTYWLQILKLNYEKALQLYPKLVLTLNNKEDIVNLWVMLFSVSKKNAIIILPKFICSCGFSFFLKRTFRLFSHRLLKFLKGYFPQSWIVAKKIKDSLISFRIF